MGQFATHGGLSNALFRFVSAFIGHRRGGVAMAAIGACAGFGAICGSSLATAATMGQVALPELRRFGYSGALATGALAAGGTLGIMIPPSVPLVIYAILTQESIGKLFVAAVIPGIIAMLGYMLVIKIYVTLQARIGSGRSAGRVAGADSRAAAGVAGAPRVPRRHRRHLRRLGESDRGRGDRRGGVRRPRGGLGRHARRRASVDSALGTAQATAMIFLVLLGADMMNTALALSQMPVELANWVKASGARRCS